VLLSPAHSPRNWRKSHQVSFIRRQSERRILAACRPSAVKRYAVDVRHLKPPTRTPTARFDAKNGSGERAQGGGIGRYQHAINELARCRRSAGDRHAASDGRFCAAYCTPDGRVRGCFQNDRCTHAIKYGAGACPASVPAAKIEAFIVDQIRRIGADPALCAETFRQCWLRSRPSVDH